MDETAKDGFHPLRTSSDRFLRIRNAHSITRELGDAVVAHIAGSVQYRRISCWSRVCGPFAC